MSDNRARRLVLASTSPHRRVLLARLGIPYDCVSPGVDEQARPGESALELVERLAFAKAQAGARQRPDALIIGSDQLATRDGAILGKPLRHAAALAQLQASSGRELSFFTAVCLIDAVTGATWRHVDETRVRLRDLSAGAIERYLALDQPYDCAGAFKVESLGVALFEWVRSSDPTALQGLPLIWLCGALAEAGLPVL
jgi:septum formation protein